MSSFQRLLHYTAPFHTRIAKASMYSILNKLFDILPEVLLGIAVDVVVNKERSFLSRLGIDNILHQLITLGLLTFFIWGMESLFQYLYSIEWRYLAQSIQHRMRLDSFTHMQNLQMGFFENASTGNLISILNDDINQLERFLDNGVNEVIQVVTSTIAIGLIFFYLAPMVAVFSLLPVPFILFGAFYFQKHIGPRYELVRERAGLLGARLSNSITGIATIKSYTSETHETEQLQKDSMGYQTANQAAIRMSAAFIPLIRMAIVVGFVATTIAGGWMSVQGDLAVGSYSILVFLTQRLLWPLTGLANLTDLYQRAMASAKRVLDLLDTPVQIQGGTKRVSPTQIKGHLQFQSVDFSYENGSQILRQFTFDIPAYQTVAFVGLTGSGKSTLMKLILRFYTPQSGHILLDGTDVADYNLQDLRRLIGFVSQDVFLFHGTVFENIAYGQKEASLEQVVQAAQMAEAHAFIMALPEQYQTVIGERGQKLSGGQRQRISIARAILKDAPIFIFDEATSAVDNETELAIQKSLERISHDRTTLMIAHRLSTIRHADQIVVLDQGRIIEQGTHAQLLQKQGYYASLWAIQTGELEDQHPSM